jgi:hypothetical protein
MNDLRLGWNRGDNRMSVQDKSIQFSAQMKVKWWYWPLLILGSVMVIGGIVCVIVL